VRKGKVGAGLPYEPWEEEEEEEEEDASGAETPCATRPASPLRVTDHRFTFYDNISTPSLDLSLASLSSLESVSSSEMLPADDPDDDHLDLSNDHPTHDLLIPSLCRLHLPTITEQPMTGDDGPVDSTGWSSSSRGYSSLSQSSGHGYPNRRGYSSNGGSRGGGNGHGDDGDGGRRRPTHVALSGSSTPGSSSDEEDSEEDYGQPIQGVTDSEDDVPLAQRIPTALDAQRSIRQKFREERDKRRRERARRAEQAAILSAPLHSDMSSSQEAALQASTQPLGRPRTRTLPSNTPRPFAPEDLARKLQDVKVAESSQPRTRPPNPEATRIRARTVDDLAPAPHVPPPTSTSPTREAASSQVLRNMRSFHRSDKRSEELQTRPSTADPTTSKLGRALSRARSRVRGEESTLPPSAWQAVPLPVSSRVSLESSPPVPPLPPQPHLVQRKLSKGSYHRVLLGKTSTEFERSPKPPVQLVQAVAVANIKTQQRIFIGDMQRFNVVEIDNNTSAENVVTMIRNQVSLNSVVGQGDWMLFEVAQDFGLGGCSFFPEWSVCVFMPKCRTAVARLRAAF
jgi:hypothetical protein